jgi:eukaryotic-like serine/threonine-protein kinase
VDSIQAQMLREELQGKVVGGWLVDGFHGNGKSAVVLPATKGDQVGAIKVFHPELVERYGKEAQLERIMREKSLVGASHENLVIIYDGGECPDTGYLYVVMESLPYENLHDQNANIPLSVIPNIIAQIASAARFLEDRNLAHRDIKPENIAISDDFTRAVLLDLGVLRPIGLSGLTDVDQRMFIGTLRYSSPEFLKRQEEDTTEGWRAVTFYQIGAVLHDLLMKEVLFAEHSEPFPKLVDAVARVKPTITSDNTDLAFLANRCLTKKPSTRLELVEWNSFMPKQGNADELTAAKERISQRQRYHHEAKVVSDGAQEPLEREIRHFLDDLSNRFQTRVAVLLNGLDAFPVRETRSELSLQERCVRIRMQFAQDEDLGLKHRLCIGYAIVLLDYNGGSPIVIANVAAALADGPIEVRDLQPFAKFYTGEVTGLLDSQELEKSLVDCLGAAYEIIERGIEPSPDQPIKLAVE